MNVSITSNIAKTFITLWNCSTYSPPGLVSWVVENQNCFYYLSSDVGMLYELQLSFQSLGTDLNNANSYSSSKMTTLTTHLSSFFIHSSLYPPLINIAIILKTTMAIFLACSPQVCPCHYKSQFRYIPMTMTIWITKFAEPAYCGCVSGNIAFPGIWWRQKNY